MRVWLLEGYLFLLYAALVFTGHERIQLLLTISWFLSFGYVWVNAKMSTVPLPPLVRAGALGQIPGILLGLIGLCSVYNNHIFLWASGLLELWVLPFLPLLELLPPFRIGQLSGVYLLSCLLPFFLIVIGIIIWRVVPAALKRV